MDSIMEEDPTLPIDFDQTTTFANYLLARKLSNDTMDTAASTPETSISEMLNTDPTASVKYSDKNGNKKPVTPNKGTMKEQEQQLSYLRKENFELKLRLFYLEGHLQRTYAEDAGDVLKTNIDLQVTIEKLKKENENNQELLQVASKALQSVDEEKAVEIAKIKEEVVGRTGKEIANLKQELKEKEEELHVMKIENKAMEEKVISTERIVEELEEKERTLKDATESQIYQAMEPLEKEILDKSRTINILKEDLEQKRKEVLESLEKQQKNEDLFKSMIDELERTLESKDTENQELKNQLKSLDSHKPEVNGRKTEVRREKLDGIVEGKDTEVKELKRELRNKVQTIEGYKDYINRTEKVNKELRNSLHETETQQRRSSTAVQETIRRLEAVVCTKDKQLSEQRKKISALQEEIKAANSASEKKRKNQLDNTQANKLAVELAELKAELELKDHELNDMKNVLDTKDKELEFCNNAKQKMEDTLKSSLTIKDSHIYNLKAELAQLIENARDSHSELDEKLQQLQEDNIIKFNQKERTIKKLSNSIHAKDVMIKNLTEMLMSATEPNQSEEEMALHTAKLLQTLRDKLKEKDEYIEKITDGGFKASDDKDAALLEFKRTLRDRDKALDRLKMTVIGNEGVIKHLEEMGREKDKTLADLKKSFMKNKKDKKSLQETLLNDSKEKSKEIMKLNNLLDRKEKQLQRLLGEKSETGTSEEAKNNIENGERIDDTPQISNQVEFKTVSPFMSHPLNLSLEASIKEREREMEELKEQMRAMSKEKDAVTQQLQELLNKKEQDLKMLDRDLKTTKAERESGMQSLRQTLEEKDLVLEELVKASQEKDRIISDLKDSRVLNARRASPSLATELAHIKEKVSRLENDLRNKEDQLKLLLEENKFFKNALEAKKGTENIEITMKFENLQNELTRKNKELAESREHMQQLKSRISAADNEDLRRKAGQLSSQIAELERREKDHKNELERLQAELEDTKLSLKVKENEVKQLKELSLLRKNKEQKEIKENEEAVTTARQSFEGKKEVYEATILDLKADIKSLEKINEGLKEQLESAHSQNRNVTEELMATKAKLELTSNPDTIKEMVQLQFQELAKLNKATENERKYYMDLVDDLLKSNKLDTVASTELNAVKSMREQLQESLKQNEELQSRLRNQISDIQLASDVQKQSASPNNSEATLKEEVKRLKEKLEESERWNNSLQLRLTESPTRGVSVGSEGDFDDKDVPSQSEMKAAITALEKEKMFLTSALADLKKECNVMKKEREKIEREKRLLEEELTIAFHQEIRRKEEERKELQGKLENESKKADRLAGQVDVLQQEINNLLTATRDRQSWGGQTENIGNEKLESDLSQQKGLNSFLKKELEAKQSEWQTMNKKIKDYENEKCTLLAEKAGIEQRMKQAEERLKELESISERGKINEGAAAERILKLAAENQSIKRGVDEVQKINERLRNQLSQVTAAYEELKIKNDEDLKAYRLELKTSTEKLSITEQNLDRESGVVIELRDQLQVLEVEASKVKRLSEELEVSQGTNRALREQLENVSSVAELRKSLMDPAITALKEEVKYLQEMNAKLSAELKENGEDHTAEIKEYKKKVEERERLLKEAEEKVEKGMIDAEEMTQTKKQLFSLQEQMSELKGNNQALREQLFQNKSMADELQRVQEELEMLRGRKENLESRVRELGSYTGSLKEEVTRLRADNSTQSNTIARLTDSLTQNKKASPVPSSYSYVTVGTQTTTVLNQAIGAGIVVNDRQIQTNLSPENDAESIDELKQKLDDASAENKSKDRLIVSLQTYIEGLKASELKSPESQVDNKTKEDLVLALIQEMRELRARLTESIRNNDELKYQLEQRLNRTDREAGSVRLPDVAISVSYENEALRKMVAEKDDVIASQKDTIQQLLKEKDEDKQKIKSLHRQIREVKDISVNLRQELSIYDHLRQQLETTSHERSSESSPDGKSGMEGADKIDQNMMYMLLEAIRKLHTQLDKTMEDNYALRKKLEEHLGHLILDTPSSGPPSSVKEPPTPPQEPRQPGVRRRQLFTSALHSVDISPSDKHGEVSDAVHFLEELPTKDTVEDAFNDMQCPHEAYRRLKSQLVDSCEKIWRVNQMLTILVSKLGKDNKIIMKVSEDASSAFTSVKAVIELVSTEMFELDVAETKDSNANDENQVEMLKKEILELKKKIRRQDQLLRRAIAQLEASKQNKEDEFKDLIGSVQGTYEVIKNAKAKLANKMEQAKNGYLVVSSKQ